MAIAGVMIFHSFNKGIYFFLFSFVLVVLITGLWWRDLIREGTYLKNHTKAVISGLRLGFILFIISEIMFFFSFFWAYFHSSLSPNIEIGSQWPPYGFDVISLKLPIVNTIILLTSGATITLGHICLIQSKKERAIEALLVTLLLAVIFTAIQVYEYKNAPFSISDGIYGSVFYILTGFHGLHVIIGTIFIGIQLIRIIKNQLKNPNLMGFDFSSWYWHFVDVVWLLLFIIVYVYGGDIIH